MREGFSSEHEDGQASPWRRLTAPIWPYILVSVSISLLLFFLFVDEPFPRDALSYPNVLNYQFTIPHKGSTNYAITNYPDGDTLSFALVYPHNGQEKIEVWSSRGQLLHQERMPATGLVDVAFFDMDGNGRDEIVYTRVHPAEAATPGFHGEVDSLDLWSRDARKSPRLVHRVRMQDLPRGTHAAGPVTGARYEFDFRSRVDGKSGCPYIALPFTATFARGFSRGIDLFARQDLPQHIAHCETATYPFSSVWTRLDSVGWTLTVGGTAPGNGRRLEVVTEQGDRVTLDDTVVDFLQITPKGTLRWARQTMMTAGGGFLGEIDPDDSHRLFIACHSNIIGDTTTVQLGELDLSTGALLDSSLVHAQYRMSLGYDPDRDRQVFGLMGGDRFRLYTHSLDPAHDVRVEPEAGVLMRSNLIQIMDGEGEILVPLAQEADRWEFVSSVDGKTRFISDDWYVATPSFFEPDGRQLVYTRQQNHLDFHLIEPNTFLFQSLWPYRWLILISVLPTTIVLIAILTVRWLRSRRAYRKMLERKNIQLQNLTHDAFRKLEQYRKQVALTLHDEVNGELAGLQFSLQCLQRDGESLQGLDGRPLTDTVSELVQTIRSLSRRLHAPVLDAPLAYILDQVGRDFTTRFQLPCEVVVDSTLDAPANVRSTVYSILQEAMNNVARHARATRVQILCEIVDANADGTSVSKDGSGRGDRPEKPVKLRVVLRDDGVGIDPGDLEKTDSLGVPGMRERARSVGGQFVIRRATPRGTEIQLTVPGFLQRAEDGFAGAAPLRERAQTNQA